MRIDELYKFSDGTLNDVRNALDDCIKGIRMQYLPTTIWRKGDKARAAAMIQAIEKMLKIRRIMRSLERFIGGRQKHDERDCKIHEKYRSFYRIKSKASRKLSGPKKGPRKAITTRSGIVLDGPTVPTTIINPEMDEPVEKTLTDPDLSKYTIKVPPHPVKKYKPSVILKKLPEKLGDPGKFLILCGFNELKCKALADLGASINLMPLSVWKKLADFVIVDYESDPRVPLILGRPFLRTARALIDVHSEEMILRDGDERLTLNMRHDTSSYSNQPQKESINLINVFNVSKGGNVLPKKLLDLDSVKDLHPPLHDNPLSGSYTYSSSPLFDVEFDLKEIEFLLHQDIDSSLKDSIDQKVESDTENVYDDPFDSKGEKIKESKLLIDELDLPCDFLPSEYDSFISQDFSRADALPSTNNEDKVFNPGVLIQEKHVEIITRVVQDKNLAISNASSMLEDFDPPFYEPLFFKEVSSILRNLKTHAEGLCPPSLHFLSFIRESCIQI
nr:hypothetical protein [Tanacetum cinerariifolium]